MLESVEENKNSLTSQNINDQNKFKNSNVSIQPAKVFHAQVDKCSNNSNKNECLICKSNHYFSQCPNLNQKAFHRELNL